MDQKFGAEIITTTGKIFKFDDIRCFVNFYNQSEDPRIFEQKLVIDYNHPGKLIPAMEAFYLKSDEIKSPMASLVAAFGEEEEMKKFRSNNGGIYMAWGEINTQFK